MLHRKQCKDKQEYKVSACLAADVSENSPQNQQDPNGTVISTKLLVPVENLL